MTMKYCTYGIPYAKMQGIPRNFVLIIHREAYCMFVVQFLQKYCEIGSAWSGVDLRTEVLSIMAPFVPISSIEKGILPELFSLSLLRVSLAKPMWEEAFLWPRAVSDLCYEARAQVKEPRVKNICIVHKWTKNHRSLLEGGEWWARKLASFPPNI
jgi:hypothetical protein